MDVLKTGAEAAAICLIIYWAFLLSSSIKFYGGQLGLQLSPWNFFQYGFYLTLVSAVYLAFDLIKSLSMD